MLLGGALLLLATAFAHAQPRVVDLDGRRVDAFDSDPAARATVFLFTTTDCPIANRYAPEVRRLAEAFGSRGVRFRLVYANPREDAATIRAHIQRFGYPVPALRDPGHELVTHLGVTVSPEAAVVDRAGAIVYRGRIDDRYADVGVDRPAPARRDLEEALTAIADGKPVRTPFTRAVGCILADFQPVTFSKHIAPLVFDRCGGCHRPTGAAPFSLLSYAEVRQRATQIAAVTRRRFMPPWKADSQAGAFAGQKRLTDGEIALVQRWIDDGALEGDRADLPPLPAWPTGWQLGTPDLIVTLDDPYVLSPEPSDVFRIFTIPLPIGETRYVTGLEFQPGNARVVHHANIRLDATPASRQLDARDPAPGYDGLLARSAGYPEGHFLGWTPGQIAPLVPADMAWRLDPGTDLVVQLHLQPSGATETVRPAIGLFFSRTPPTRTPTILRLGSQGIDIAPGTARHVITDSYVLPTAVELHALQPHAHYRAREIRGTATFPDGSTRTLIEIGDWDFRWQHVYRFVQPVPLPKGTRVAMQYTYDNSAANPRNPQLPPQRVFWGQRSFDEMGDLWFQFVARSASDRATMTAGIQRKMTAEDLIGLETLLRASPRDAELHDDAAVLYLATGQAERAIDHFRSSAALKPGEAAAHFNLGTALSVAGRLEDAVHEYREALRLRPGYAAAHNNLGLVLATQGRVAEALSHFREAVRLDPGNAQAQRNLATYARRVP
jgi:hypothetical protein